MLRGRHHRGAPTAALASHTHRAAPAKCAPSCGARMSGAALSHAASNAAVAMNDSRPNIESIHRHLMYINSGNGRMHACVYAPTLSYRR